jgi:hypothetical protein
MTRKNSIKDQLWNVSLLPTVKVEPSAGPPPGPAPRGGTALSRPAVLSLADATSSLENLAAAA